MTASKCLSSEICRQESSQSAKKPVQGGDEDAPCDVFSSFAMSATVVALVVMATGH